MSGRLTIVGLGPGNPGQLTIEATEALNEATDLYGYAAYLDRLSPKPCQQVHRSDNREELARADAALLKAATGANVAVVSGGDPGVFAMAAAVCEAVHKGPKQWSEIEIRVLPGITAMLAVAARVGAPLGHDFCAISLSDNLKPWRLILKRLAAAAEAGFVIALYNPASRARPHQLGEALAHLKNYLGVQTPVIFGRAAGRPDESIAITTLGEADPAAADMATCVIIGSAETHIIDRPERLPLVYTSRFASESCQ